jgi:hypothetical protein
MTTMVRETAATTIAWPLMLAATAVLGTLAAACMMPFVAVATIAAATMPRSRALVTVVGTWGANQLLGFGLLGYPWTGYAALWGGALGGTAVAAMLVAGAVTGGRQPQAGRLILSFVVAFAVFEVLLFAFSLVAGGTGTFAPSIVALLFASDAVWLGGLTILFVALTRAAPRVFGPSPALRFG